MMLRADRLLQTTTMDIQLVSSVYAFIPRAEHGLEVLQ